MTVSCVLWHTHQFVFPSTLNLSPNSSLTLIQSFCVWCLTSTQPYPNSNKLSLWRLTKDLTQETHLKHIFKIIHCGDYFWKVFSSSAWLWIFHWSYACLESMAFKSRALLTAVYYFTVRVLVALSSWILKLLLRFCFWQLPLIAWKNGDGMMKGM